MPGPRRSTSLPGWAGGLTTEVDTAQVESIFREESGRAIASLVKRFGDIDIAEEAVQEAFLEATRRWPESGAPPSPIGWIITTARNRAVDRLRRESLRDNRQSEAMYLESLRGPEDPEPVDDDRLKLIFTCCHPALDVESQVALTLRLIGGLRTPEIARAFLVKEATMGQRLSRAKRKIRDANIPYRIPLPHELPDRTASVLAVVYLIFNEGYVASSGDELLRSDLAGEAIRLGRVLADLMPDEPEVIGLLALMLLTESRSPSRVDTFGEVVRLPDQDRRQWDRSLISEGQALVRACLRRNRPGRYQIQAAIAAVHSDAPSAEETDWGQILRLYDQLLAMYPSPVVRVNRAVALAEVDGAETALADLDRAAVEDYYIYHAVRADLLARLDRPDDAVEALHRAIELSDNSAEQALLTKRIEELSAGRNPLP